MLLALFKLYSSFLALEYLIPPFQDISLPVLQPVVEGQELLDAYSVNVSRVLLSFWPGQRLAF